MTVPRHIQRSYINSGVVVSFKCYLFMIFQGISIY